MNTLKSILNKILTIDYEEPTTWQNKARIITTVIMIGLVSITMLVLFVITTLAPVVIVTFALTSAGTTSLANELIDLTLLGSSTAIYQLIATSLSIYAIFLVPSGLLLLATYKKRGFRNLKKFSKLGLKSELVFGLGLGLFIGLIAWLVTESVYGLDFGLIFGLIIASVSGWTKEFKDQLDYE